MNDRTEKGLEAGLYVVATPIGNLGDISARAAHVLRSAVLVCAEDTRTTKRLMDHAGASTRLLSLTEHNVNERMPQVLAEAEKGAVALVSDAGTPVVADPGARLVAGAHERGVAVIAVPGPSALTAAVSVSGFEGSDVHFLGFLPRQRGERFERLTQAATAASVLVFFESPARLGRTLAELGEVLGDPEVCVCRELTKVHEETVRGRASQLSERFREVRGECTVVVRVPERKPAGEAELTAYMQEMRRAGARRASAAVEAARRFSVPRDRAYALWGE